MTTTELTKPSEMNSQAIRMFFAQRGGSTEALLDMSGRQLLEAYEDVYAKATGIPAANTPWSVTFHPITKGCFAITRKVNRVREYVKEQNHYLINSYHSREMAQKALDCQSLD